MQVTCSYLQIYQERVYDLLGTDKSGPEVYLREHPKKGRVIKQKNLNKRSKRKGDQYGFYYDVRCIMKHDLSQLLYKSHYIPNSMVRHHLAGKPTRNQTRNVIFRMPHVCNIVHDLLLSVLGVYVENLSEYFVKCPEEIGRLLKSGKKKLAIAETKMNRQSSRWVQRSAFY